MDEQMTDYDPMIDSSDEDEAAVEQETDAMLVQLLQRGTSTLGAAAKIRTINGVGGVSTASNSGATTQSLRLKNRYEQEQLIGGGLVFKNRPLFLHDGKCFLLCQGDAQLKLFSSEQGQLLRSIPLTQTLVGQSQLKTTRWSVSDMVLVPQLVAQNRKTSTVALLYNNGMVQLWSIPLETASQAHIIRQFSICLATEDLSSPSSGIEFVKVDAWGTAQNTVKFGRFSLVPRGIASPQQLVIYVSASVNRKQCVYRGTIDLGMRTAANAAPQDLLCEQVLSTYYSKVVDMATEDKFLAVMNKKKCVVLEISGGQEEGENVSARIVFEKELPKPVPVNQQHTNKQVQDTLFFTCLALREAVEPGAGPQMALADTLGNIYFVPRVAAAPQTQFLWTWHSTIVNSLCFSIDGNFLYSGGDEGMLVTWDLGSQSGGSSKTFTYAQSPIANVSVSPQQDRYVVSTRNNYLLLLDPSQRKPIARIKGLMVDASVSSNSTTAKSKQGQPRPELIIDPRTKGCILLSGSNYVQWYSLLQQSSLQEECVHFRALNFDPSRFRSAQGGFEPVQARVSKLAYSADGTFLAHAETQTGSRFALRFWQKQAQQQHYEVISAVEQPHEAPITSIRFHPLISQICVTTSLDGSAKLWTKSAQKPFFLCSAVLQLRNGNALPCTSCCFSLDGSILFVAFGSILSLWNVQSMRCIGEFSFSSDSIQQLETLTEELVLIRTKSSVSVVSMLTQSIVYSFTSDMVQSTVIIPQNAELAVHAASRQFAFCVLERLSGRMLLIVMGPSSLLHVIPLRTTSQIVSLKFVDQDNVWLLTDRMEVLQACTVSLGPAEEEKSVDTSAATSMDIDQEEGQDQDESSVASVWLKNVRASLSGAAFSRLEQLKRAEREVQAFDPQSGVGAWKSLFNASSHALAAPSSQYRAFMDAFILKRNAPLVPVSSVATAVAASEQTSVADKQQAESVAPAASAKAKRNDSVRMPEDLVSFLRGFSSLSLSDAKTK